MSVKFGLLPGWIMVTAGQSTGEEMRLCERMFEYLIRQVKVYKFKEQIAQSWKEHKADTGQLFRLWN